MENQQPETLETASQIELAITCGFIGSAEQYEHLLLSAVSHLRRLHAINKELEAMLESVGAGSVSAQRVDALYKALEVCSAELFAQCAHQGRAMKYVEQARKALAAEQCARAAIAAAKGE